MSRLVFTCIITESTAGHPSYTPVLPEYASNNQFVGMANFIYLVVEIGIEFSIAVSALYSCAESPDGNSDVC